MHLASDYGVPTLHSPAGLLHNEFNVKYHTHKDSKEKKGLKSSERVVSGETNGFCKINR